MLRNRQAAQSSRERKRQEVEKLEGEKIGIERQNYLLKERLMAVEHDKFRLSQQLAKMSAEISNLRSRAPSREPSRAPPSGVPSPALTADLLNHDLVIKQELEDYPFALPSPEDTLDPRSSFSDASSRASSRSPSPSRSNMEFNGIVTSPDMTQHPAAMLCGLQCQSGAAWRPSLCRTTPPRDEAQSLPYEQMYILSTLATQHLSLMLHSVVFSTLLQPLSHLLLSLKRGSRLKMRQVKKTPMLFHLIQWLISRPVNSTMPTTCSLPPPSRLHLHSTFRISLLRRLLACSPALARPLKDATGRALQMKTGHALRGISNGNATTVDGKLSDDSMVCDTRFVQGGWQSLMTMALGLHIIEKHKVNRKKRARAKERKSVGTKIQFAPLWGIS